MYKSIAFLIVCNSVNFACEGNVNLEQLDEKRESGSDDRCGFGTAGMTDNVWEPHIKIPWTATLYLRTESQPDKIYPALILTRTMILIGANKLFADGDKKLQLFPFLNYEARTNTSTFSEIMTPNMQFSQITHIRIHPKYSGLFKRDEWPISHNNFAIAHLKTPIVFDPQVHLPCIPSNSQLETILSSWPNLTNSVIVHGWKRHVSDSLVLRLAPNNQTVCQKFWYGHEETSHATYIDRICANVSSLNSHTLCINMGVGIFTKQDTRYYFTGLVNNLYSDNRTCTPKTRYFISHATPQVLEWIRQNEKCGPNQFTCSDGACIPLEGSLCNRTAECADASDEDPIVCRGFHYCNVKEFGCGVYGKCINQNLTCDGKHDCEEGEDETDCPSSTRSPLLAILLSISAISILIVAIVAFMFWRKMKQAEEKLRCLTDEEVAEFEHGALAGDPIPSQPLKASTHVYTNSPSDVLQPEKFAWDGLRFEIPKNNLIIDWQNKLGSGISGIVYRGSFVDHKKGRPNTGVAVAVKTFKNTADVESFKMVLSELKIMTRVGNHENIVALVGAYTREIKQRILYIALEFCGMGDLEGFLKKNRNSFVAGVSGTEETPRNRIYEQNRWTMTYVNKEVLDGKSHQLGINNLHSWSHDIENGMAHLASLNITHGDLATRNILINENFIAKISDFGLSRNLYESGIYVKKQTAPLPWRWMAVESLRDFEFSTHSDVWAYGVTLWEIYSLGGVPFPGLGWTSDFIGKLYSGLRMAKPSYASNEIYDKMLDCWENIPTRRPHFSNLQTFFRNLKEFHTNDGVTNL